MRNIQTSLLSALLCACAVPETEDGTAVQRALEASDSDGGRVGLNAMDGYNQPSRILENPEVNWNQLPLSGQLSVAPWSGSYWPKQKGGIAYRWQSDESHTYQTLSADEVTSAGMQMVNDLSPAEKYDLYVGNYQWPLTKRTMSESSPNEASWTGYCHGWSSASVHFDEPSPVRMVNPDGIVVPFGSSDIKALLTYFYGEVLRSTHMSHEWRSEISTVGTLCLSNSGTDPGCTDTNAGAFHILLANLVGVRDQSLLMDVDNTYEKWNQPISGYFSEVLADRTVSDEDSRTVSREIYLATEVEYVVEIEPTWEAVLGTSGQHTKTANYLYKLQLNDSDEIIGGDWVIRDGNGRFLTLQQAWDHLSNLDENGDGNPDHTVDEASNILWSYFKFPDYLWVQEEGLFAPVFEQAASGYSLLATNRTTREDLYGYFGALADIYEASTR